MAWFRIAQAKGLLVLGSATPDLKTFYAVREAKIPVSTLPARVGGGTLPSIRLVDIRSMNCAESILAPETLSALKQTVEQGDQAVILLNRRGYAPLMYCIDCGKVARCPHCDIGLTYHKGRERLVCHYCGYSVPFPSPCPSCKGCISIPWGREPSVSKSISGRFCLREAGFCAWIGTAPAVRGAWRRSSSLLPGRRPQVLVGTQMLSKGTISRM